MAEENGLEVMDKLEATPVSTRAPQEAAGLQTLTTEEEDTLSSRCVDRHTFWLHGHDGGEGGGRQA